MFMARRLLLILMMRCRLRYMLPLFAFLLLFSISSFRCYFAAAFRDYFHYAADLSSLFHDIFA